MQKLATTHVAFQRRVDRCLIQTTTHMGAFYYFYFSYRTVLYFYARSYFISAINMAHYIEHWITVTVAGACTTYTSAFVR